jgi:DNA-directed RNA polymerase subunit RPC12/RpoP
MVFDASIAATLRCKNCGKLIVKSVSYFELKAERGGLIQCECGYTVLKMRSLDLKTFHVSIPCLACDQEHLYILKWRSIPFHKIKILRCLVTSHDVAFIGDGDLVRKIAARHERDIIELMRSI